VYYHTSAAARPLSSSVRCLVRTPAIIFFGILNLAHADEIPPPVKGLEFAQNLGHEFWLLTIAEPSASTFEAVGHFRHCYFKQQDLGVCHTLSPSPSGLFAVYQRADTASVMFFDSRGTKSEVTITSSAPGILRSVYWSEPQHRVSFDVAPPSGSPQTTITYEFLH